MTVETCAWDSAYAEKRQEVAAYQARRMVEKIDPALRQAILAELRNLSETAGQDTPQR